jgi:hypothetical protein
VRTASTCVMPIAPQVICTFKQGRIAAGGAEAQQFRASGLNLVIAAIVFWNSTYIADAVAHLRAIGEPAPDTRLAHTSPLTWDQSIRRSPVGSRRSNRRHPNALPRWIKPQLTKLVDAPPEGSN